MREFGSEHSDRPKLNETIVDYARRARRAEYAGGACSACGQGQTVGNFCEACGATFLTDGQLEKGEGNI